MLRTARSLPPDRAFDAGLRPDPFPDRAASLLPGLLAATRTGLTPAGDDELKTKVNYTSPPPGPLGARIDQARTDGTPRTVARTAGRAAVVPCNAALPRLRDRRQWFVGFHWRRRRESRSSLGSARSSA